MSRARSALRLRAHKVCTRHENLASSEPSQGLVRLGLGLSNQRSQLVLRLVPRAARLRQLELRERELLPQPEQLRVQPLVRVRGRGGGRVWVGATSDAAMSMT